MGEGAILGNQMGIRQFVFPHSLSIPGPAPQAASGRGYASDWPERGSQKLLPDCQKYLPSAWRRLN